MKILVVAPFGRIEPGMKENLANRARAGTHVDVECLEEVFPLPYNTYQYNLTKCIDGTVERAIRAEAEGYDAFVISGMIDPGLIQTRGTVDIPVVGALEASAHVASMMCNRFTLIAAEPTAVAQMQRLLAFYGLSDKTTKIRHVGIVSNKLYPEETPTEEVFRRIREQARLAVHEDGAELIISGCTIVGGMMTQRYGTDQGWMLEGVPVIDGTLVAFKVAEMMIDLVALGYPPVSRFGFWARPPAEETRELRQWFSEHDSAFKYNHDRMPESGG